MKDIEINGNTAYCRGFSTDMEITFETPVETITVEIGRVTDIFPNAETLGAKIIRVTARDEIKVIIKPHNKITNGQF